MVMGVCDMAETSQKSMEWNQEAKFAFGLCFLRFLLWKSLLDVEFRVRSARRTCSTTQAIGARCWLLKLRRTLAAPAGGIGPQRRSPSNNLKGTFMLLTQIKTLPAIAITFEKFIGSGLLVELNVPLPNSPRHYVP